MKHPNPESEWFGNSAVTPDEKTNRVKGVFSSVAPHYDLMNDLMSFGMHRLWKNRFCRLIHPRAGDIIYDIGGGTGDIACRLAKATRGEATITVCDLSPEMIAHGKEKAINEGWPPKGENQTGCIKWIEGNAEKLPFGDNEADILCIAFALRNVTHIDTALKEFHRVLKKGGRFFCMELSNAVPKETSPFYDFYSETAIPWLGEKIAHDKTSYQYLIESIRKFPPPALFTERLKTAGFSSIETTPLFQGVATIHACQVAGRDGHSV